MPFRPLSFEKTGADTPLDRNWRILDEASKSRVFIPTIAAATVTPTPGQGIWVLYGPVTFFSIPIVLNNGDGWTTSTTLTIPYSEAQNLVNTGLGYYNFQVFNAANGAVITTAYMSTTAGISVLKFTGAYTNTSGSDQTIGIQGWYFRN